MKRIMASLGCVLLVSACGTDGHVSGPSPTSPGSTNGTGSVCIVAFTLGTTTFDHDGGHTDLTITASNATCSWQVSAPYWVALAPGASGAGSAVLTLSLAGWSSVREGVVTLGNQSVTIVQRPTMPVRANVVCRQGRAGTVVPGACTVGTFVYEFEPRSTGLEVMSDLRAFGGSANYRWAYVTASGGTLWDLDLRIPQEFPPGPVEIPVRVTDQQGRELRLTGVFTVLPASSQ